MRKKVVIAAIFAATMVLFLGLSALRPVVVCRVDVPEHYLEAITGQSKGAYSDKLPLVPVCVSVDAFARGRVYYTIYYFPFGTVDMTYAEDDGYNIEKHLTGW